MLEKIHYIFLKKASISRRLATIRKLSLKQGISMLILPLIVGDIGEISPIGPLRTLRARHLHPAESAQGNCRKTPNYGVCDPEPWADQAHILKLTETEPDQPGSI